MRIARTLAALVCAAFLMMGNVPSALSQAEAPELTIAVTDSSGGRVVNAAVTLSKGNEVRTLRTDATGAVRASNLSTGEWTLAVRSDGFQPQERPVIFQGITQSVTVALAVAPVTTNVLVETTEGIPSAVQLNATASGGSYLDVSVRDLPFNLSVINQDYIRERGVTNFLDALELVSGVTTFADSGYIPGVDIRGFSTTDAGIFIAENGIVQNSVPQAVRNQDPFFLESIEVLKGPSSFSYGSGTAGASINSRAKMPKNELGFDALFTYGSWGRTREGFSVTGPITKNLSALFGVVHNQGGTLVQRTQSSGRNWNTGLTWTPAQRVTFSAQGIYRTDHLSTYFGTPILNRQIDPNVNYVKLADNTFLDPRTRSINYNMTDPLNDVKYRRATTDTQIDLSGGWKLQHKFYIVSLLQDTLNNEGIQFNQTTLRVTPTGYFFNFKRDWMHGNEVNIRNTFRFGENQSLQFTVGGRVERNNQVRHAADNSLGDTGTIPSMDWLNPISFGPAHRRAMRANVNDTDYNTGFFEAAFRILPKLTLSGGLRWDHVSNARLTLNTGIRNKVGFHPVTGRYALTYQLRPTVAIYIGHSKAVQPAGTGTGSTGAVALVGLNTQQAQFTTQPSRGWEGGVKASAFRERLVAEMSYFQTRKYNIQNQEIIDGVTFIERVGKIKSEGVDTSFMISPNRTFTLQGNLVWNNGEYLVFQTVANGIEVDRSGNKLARVPAVQFSVTPILRIGPVSGSVSIRSRGASWNNANNTQRLRPLTLLNSDINIALTKGFRVTLAGRNMTDEIVMNRGGIVEGSTTANLRPDQARNYTVQIQRQW